MFINRIPDLSRRAFLQRASALSVVGGGSALALNLAAAGEAAAQEATDYKALVCVFMAGGNDYANTVVPYDTTNYDRYSAIRGGGAGRTRGGIALGRDELTPTALSPIVNQTLTDDLQYALSPQLTNLAALFRMGRAAVQLNAGTLIAPTTLAQYTSANRAAYPLPPKLFSHNDQQSFWQALGAEGATTGWGGRLGDMALSSNGNSALTCISAAGNAVFVSGNSAIQYQIGLNGAVAVSTAKSTAYGSSAISAAMRQLITQSSGNIMENEFAKVTARSLNLENTVNTALTKVNLTTPFDTNNASNNLADQLKIVARLIGARNALGMTRQVFFVQLNGFDMHDDLLVNHAPQMAYLDEAIGQFYKATVEMGVADKVTTFTASDFGRTLSSNGDGSDHGWGSHHFIVGGAVKGGRYYGTAPHVSLSTDDQVGQGRLLPTTSVDQIAATLGRWFGVSSSQLPTVLPNIGRFATSNLGYFG